MDDATSHNVTRHQLIEAFGNHGFKLNGQRYEGSVIVFADHTESWPVTDWAVVQGDDFRPILQAKSLPEIVIAGCGERFEMVPKAIKRLFHDYGISIEAMDTGTACRTYNILLSEGRKVAAALVAI